MKYLLIFISTILGLSSIAAQIQQPYPNAMDFGGGEVPFEEERKEPCVTEEQYASIRQMLDINKEMIHKKKPLSKSAMPPTFIFPLRQSNSYNDPGYYVINNYVDQDPSSGVQDYNCGARTYDGHRGMDIDARPFGWYKMDHDHVEVIAGAAGTITLKNDGYFDKYCCLDCGNTSWNVVYIEHSDGSESRYGHLKSGTLTDKPVGSSVAQGEYLGVVGSSGNSTYPHLHFEVRDNQNNVIDPFAGACNNLNPNSWWETQPSYWEPRLNKIATHSSVPNLGNCPNDEQTNFDNFFLAGSTVIFATYLYAERAGHVKNMEILDANNSIVYSWSHTSPADYELSWWYWTYSLPTNHPAGKWRFQVTYLSQVVTHEFMVGDICHTNLFIGNQDINTSSTTESSNYIETTGNLNVYSPSLVRFTAGNYVDLNAGFDAIAGSYFDSYILSCSPINESGIENRSLEQQVSSKLFQNYPNPFTDDSDITFYVAPNSKEAMIRVYSIEGVLIFESPILNKGDGILNIQNKLPSKGIYYYTLEVDNQILETRKMVYL